jgi:membrane protein DedA with SNARE-associated domain
MAIEPVITFLAHYKYLAIFPIAVTEGPIISIICGFLVSRGVLSFVWVFLVVWSGDLISDSFFYYLGRGGKRFIKEWNFFKINDERIAKIEQQYERSPWKTMIVAKVSYGLGMVFMVASGVSKMSFKKFIYFAGVLNAFRSLVLIAIGYYFGKLALRLGPTYITYYTVGVLVFVPCIYFLVKRLKS